jgi:hypothetical protein
VFFAEAFISWDELAAVMLQSTLGRFSFVFKSFLRQKCTSLWISCSFAPVAERCGSDKPSKPERAERDVTTREVKQQDPKEVRSYSTSQRMPDRYSSSYMLHNLVCQDSFALFLQQKMTKNN